MGICEFCGKEFKGRIIEQRFCGPLCQRKDYNRRPEIREKYRLRIKEYRKSHPEWKEKHRIFQAKYSEKRKLYRKIYFKRPEVKAKISENRRKRLKEDLNFAIKDRLRRSLNHAFTKYSRTGKIMSSRNYGLDWNEIILCLKPFPKDIRNYEIDHIIPLNRFNLTNPEKVKKAFCPKNLRWLTKEENRKKGGRVIILKENL